MTIGELISELQKLDQTRLVMLDGMDALYEVRNIRECSVLTDATDTVGGAVEIDGHEDEYDENSTFIAVVLS